MTSRDRLVIVLVLVVAAVVGSWLIVLQPKRDRAAKLRGEVTAAQSQLDAARSTLVQARQAQQSFQAETAQLARLGEAVPADDDVPSLIYQLQHAANGARIDFQGLATSASAGSPGSASATTPSGASPSAALPPNVTVGTDGFPTESFTFTFQGTYLQLTKFIDRVQNFVTVKGDAVSVRGRLLSLKSINLAAASSGFPNITATVAASTYVIASTQATTGTTPTPTSPSAASSSPTASTSGSAPSAPAPAAATPIR